jgi:microcin C transport system substrate-binding protein
MNHRTVVRWLHVAMCMAALFGLWGCGEDPAPVSAPRPGAAPAPPPRANLPGGILWQTNDTDPIYASPTAVRGGTLHEALLSFPLTFRTVGPDSNSSFRSAILDNQLSLIGIHPNTERIIPELATHWAFDPDGRTMYFKLNPEARWSDGHRVTADDFAFTLDFMRSKHIVAPWYNDYYSREIEKVVVYDDHTLAVVAARPVPDLHLRIGLGPTPRHYYGTLDADFVRAYNWRIVPNTGPYQISDFEKGRRIRFKRQEHWWGDNLRYFKHRFNVDKVVYTVVRDFNLMWEHFKKGRLDTFGLNLPDYWHVKSRTEAVRRGYIERIWFFNDTQQSAQGLWLNLDRDLFCDPRLRYAFAHAMNIETVIEKVLRGDYFRLEHGFMGYGAYSHPQIRARRFDLDKVTALMTEAGWRRGRDGIWSIDGRRFAVEVTYTLEEHTPRLVVLKEEAKKAGIELTLRRLDPAASFKKVLEKKHDVAWMGWSTSLRPQYWEHFHSDNAHKPQTNNITNTDDPEMDRLIEAYRSSLDGETRARLSRRIQERIHEIGAFVPTFMVPYVRQAYWRWWRLPDPAGTRHSNNLFDPFNSATGGLFWFDAQRHHETREAMKAGRVFGPATRIDDTYKMASIR